MATPTTRLDELLTVAIGVFSQRGYGGTSVQAVADAAGIRKPSMYKHINAKEDLLFGVLDRAHRQSVSLMEEVKALNAPPLERLREYLVRHVLWYLNDVDLLNVFFREWSSVVTPERRALIADRRRGYDHFLRGLIAECQAAGEADPQLDVKYASFYLLGAVNATVDWFGEDADDTPEGVARDTAELAVSMITAARVTPA
jgi:AcrR family transcriptional regulator